MLKRMRFEFWYQESLSRVLIEIGEEARTDYLEAVVQTIDEQSIEAVEERS